jgi:hypothetical protein
MNITEFWGILKVNCVRFISTSLHYCNWVLVCIEGCLLLVCIGS